MSNLTRLSDLMRPALVSDERLKPLTPIKQRLTVSAARAANGSDEAEALYQHTVLCQTCLPFRDPGAARLWEQNNGYVTLQLQAGEAMHPLSHRFVQVGLPFGPKARMILMHINQCALRQRRPEIQIADTLTKFVRESLQLDSQGRNMRIVKDQLSRLATSTIRIGMVRAGHALTFTGQIMSAFDIWFPKDADSRVLWPSTIRLSAEYFDSLRAHAVPLREDHIAALSHSALALDVYSWLANRLHRIHPARPSFISWRALHAQFGSGYASVRKFRQVFKVTLGEVLQVYHGNIELLPNGFALRATEPPVAYRPMID